MNAKDPQAMYLAAGKYEREGDSYSARKVYEQIIDRFPSSTFAAKANDQLLANQRSNRARSDLFQAQQDAQRQQGSVPSKPAKKKWTPATLAQTTRANAGAIAIAFVKPPPDGCRSEDAANYVRGTEGLDLLYAHRPLARQLLDWAYGARHPMGTLRVISVEGLIGFKLRGYVNDATRTRDLDDIRALVRQRRHAQHAGTAELLCLVPPTRLVPCTLGLTPYRHPVVHRKNPRRQGGEAVLAREAGVPFAPVPDSTTPIDHFVRWLSLMEVVEMLCPVWPVPGAPHAWREMALVTRLLVATNCSAIDSCLRNIHEG